jgi:hypothetical protein
MPLSRPGLLLVLALLPHLAALAVDHGSDVERTTLAHLLTFGRPPATAITSADTLAAQLERHRAELQSNDDARARTAHAAWFDAFGRPPTADELHAEAALPLTYPERLQRHLERLRNAPDENRAVIHRAYRLVVHRDAYAEEFDYWRPHGVRSFVVLVACIEDWARRNRPGLMVTAGNPAVSARSRFVTIVRITPELAAEARALLALERPAAEPSRVLAIGAERIATAGGMHAVLVGRD